MPSPSVSPDENNWSSPYPSNFERTLGAVCEAAVRLVGVDHSGLVLFDQGRQFGTVTAEYPLGNPSIIGTTIRVKGISAEEDLLANGKPIVVNDLVTDHTLGAVRDVLLKMGVKSIVVVPIIVEGEVKGSFSFDAIVAEREFAKADTEKCSDLAAFASLVVKNAYELNNVEPLRQAMLAIASAQDREPLLKAITVQAVTLLNADSGGIDEFDAARRELSVIAAYNLPIEIIGQKLEVGQGIAGGLIDSSLDYLAQSNYSDWELRAKYKSVGEFGSVIGVPLLVDNNRTGVLWVNGAKGRVFDRAEIELLKRLAAPASIALEQSILRERERNRVKRLERLSSATFDMLGSLTSEPAERLMLIAKRAHEVTDAEAGGILLVEQPGVLVLVASDGHKEGGFEQGKRFEIVSGEGTGLTGHIASTGQVLRECGSALKNHPAVKHKGADYATPSPECYSLLAIPLRKQNGELCGLLKISNKKDKDGKPNEWTCFTDDDQFIGELFAQAAMIAIETADLLTEVKQGENRYRTVLEACNVLAQAKAPEDGLHALAEMIVGLLGKSFCRIALFNEAEESLQVVAAVKTKNKKQFMWNPHVGEQTKVSRWPGLGDALLTGRPSHLQTTEGEQQNNLRALAEWIELKDPKGAPLQIRSMLRIPIKVGSRTIGLLNVGDVESAEFRPAEQAQAVAISEQVALLIERLEREKKLLYDLFETEREINASDDIEKTLRLVASQVYDVTHAWGRSVTVVDINVREGSKVRVVAAHPEDRLQSIREIVGSDFDLHVGKDGRIGIVGRVMLEGKAINAADVASNKDYFPIHADTRSQLVVPIKDGNGDTIGAIGAESSQPGAFDEQDQILVEGIASQASSAIGKALQSRENKKVRTIALVGAAGSIWKHSLQGAADLIQSEVDAASNILSGPPEVLAGLKRIKDRADEVLKFPFTGPLSEDKGISVEILNDVIQERLRRLRNYLKEHHQESEIDADLRASEGVRVQINKAWFQYALKIFLVNAREAVRAAAQKKIAVRTEKVGNSHFLIVVTNTGSKIRDEVWLRLGHEQVDREDGNRERGVGLLIADLILAVYGGRVEKIRNEENRIELGVVLPASPSN